MNTSTAIISWGLPVEELVAATKHGATRTNIKPNKTIQAADFDANATTIFVFGTYYDNLDVVHERCPGAKVTCLVYSAKDEGKYGTARVTYANIYDEVPFAGYPWMRMISNRSNPKTSTAEDEMFYRGLIHTFAPPASGSLYDAVVAMMGARWTVDELVATGKVLTESQKQAAEHAVEAAGLRIRAGGQDAVVVSGAWNGVMPTAWAAAAGGCIGVNLRYNFQTQRTHLTFFANDDQALDFVRAPPFNGGGTGTCNGATISGIVPIIAGLALEECIERAASH